MAAAAEQRQPQFPRVAVGELVMEQPAWEAARRELERFVGEWTIAAGPPGGPLWTGEARARFEWLEDAFVVQRWTQQDGPEGAPTGGTTIIGCDVANGSLVQLHTDSRGVHRVYQMGLNDGVWTLRRDGAPFSQRF